MALQKLAAVNRPLIKEHPLLQTALICGLHLNGINGTRIIPQIDIQADSMALIAVRDILLIFNIFNPVNLFSQQLLQKELADIRIPHDLPKHEVILQRQFLQGRSLPFQFACPPYLG